MEKKMTKEAKHKIETKKKVAYIDWNLKQLSKYIGRKLTAKEEAMVLDIADAFTPKNKKGYKIKPLPFYYVWEIYMAAKTSKSVDALSGMIKKYNQSYAKKYLK